MHIPSIDLASVVQGDEASTACHLWSFISSTCTAKANGQKKSNGGNIALEANTSGNGFGGSSTGGSPAPAGRNLHGSSGDVQCRRDALDARWAAATSGASPSEAALPYGHGTGHRGSRRRTGRQRRARGRVEAWAVAAGKGAGGKMCVRFEIMVVKVSHPAAYARFATDDNRCLGCHYTVSSSGAWAATRGCTVPSLKRSCAR